MNQEILAYLRALITYTLFALKNLLPTAMLRINNRKSVKLGMNSLLAK